MVMEIRQLRSFVAVAEDRHFRKSALPLSDAAATFPMGVVTRDEPPGAVLARLLDELAVAPARVAEAA
jgi:hypothetical protein